MKAVFSFFFLMPLFVMTSCGTFNNRYHYFGDAKNIESSKVALLAVDSDLTIKAINGKKVNFNLTAGDKVIYLQGGEYSFTIKYYHNFPGAQRAAYTKDVIMEPFTLEGGKHYVLTASLFTGNSVLFFIKESPVPVDTKERISITL